MQSDGTLLLRRSDVEALLNLPDCIDAVEEIRPAMTRAWGDPGAVRVVRWPLTVLAGRA